MLPNCPIFPKSAKWWHGMYQAPVKRWACREANQSCDFLGAGNAGNKPKGVPQNHHGWYQTQMVGLHGIGFTAFFHNKGKVPTWWLIPLSKWVITPVISGLSLLIPFITGVITHLLSGMSHQAITILIALKTFSHQSPVAKLWFFQSQSP